MHSRSIALLSIPTSVCVRICCRLVAFQVSITRILTRPVSSSTHPQSLSVVSFARHSIDLISSRTCFDQKVFSKVESTGPVCCVNSCLSRALELAACPLSRVLRIATNCPSNQVQSDLQRSSQIHPARLHLKRRESLKLVRTQMFVTSPHKMDALMFDLAGELL